MSMAQIHVMYSVPDLTEEGAWENKERKKKNEKKIKKKESPELKFVIKVNEQLCNCRY